MTRKMIGIYAPQEVAIGEGPHLWVQWKGTDVCCDFHCTCGFQGHFDGDFAYGYECPKCHQLYETGTHVYLYPVTNRGEWWPDSCPKIPRGDDAP